MSSWPSFIKRQLARSYLARSTEWFLLVPGSSDGSVVGPAAEPRVRPDVLERARAAEFEELRLVQPRGVGRHVAQDDGGAPLEDVLGADGVLDVVGRVAPGVTHGVVTQPPIFLTAVNALNINRGLYSKNIPLTTING